MNSFTRSWMAFQDESTTMGVSAVVSMTSRSATPSIPRWKPMPRLGIQGAWTSNWNSRAPGAESKPNQRPSEARKVATVTMSASALCCFGSAGGKKAAATAPASGRKTTMESRFAWDTASALPRRRRSRG